MQRTGLRLATDRRGVGRTGGPRRTVERCHTMKDNQVKLPGVDRAVVTEDKIREYLLSDAHPVGRFKATFFAGMGYSATGWEVLAADLRGHALEHKVSATDVNEYGQKYEIRGTIAGPVGKTAVVVAVWIVLHGEDFPRFVTAFPGARS